MVARPGTLYLNINLDKEREDSFRYRFEWQYFPFRFSEYLQRERESLSEYLPANFNKFPTCVFCKKLTL